MGRGTSKAGGGGSSSRVANTEQQSTIDELARDMATGDLTNGDMQGAVEAYALTHPGVDEDAMIDAIRQKADQLSSASNPRVQSYIDTLNNPKSTLSQNQREDLLSTIQNTTNIGDTFEWKGNTGTKIEFTKSGRNKWQSNDSRYNIGNGTTSKSLRDIMVTMENGKWRFKSKK